MWKKNLTWYDFKLINKGKWDKNFLVNSLEILLLGVSQIFGNLNFGKLNDGKSLNIQVISNKIKYWNINC